MEAFVLFTSIAVVCFLFLGIMWYKYPPKKRYRKH